MCGAVTKTCVSGLELYDRAKTNLEELGARFSIRVAEMLRPSFACMFLRCVVLHCLPER